MPMCRFIVSLKIFNILKYYYVFHKFHATKLMDLFICFASMRLKTKENLNFRKKYHCSISFGVVALILTDFGNLP